MIDFKKIQAVVLKMKCSKHNEYPKNVKIIKKGFKDAGISFTPCCDDFQKKVEKQISVEMDKGIDGAIGGLFS